jgi:hypothetical protein
MKSEDGGSAGVDPRLGPTWRLVNVLSKACVSLRCIV